MKKKSDQSSAKTSNSKKKNDTLFGDQIEVFNLSELETNQATAAEGLPCYLDDEQFIYLKHTDPAVNGDLCQAIEDSAKFKDLPDSVKSCANPNTTPQSPEGRLFQNRILGQGFLGKFQLKFEDKVYSTAYWSDNGEIVNVKGKPDDLFKQTPLGRTLVLNTFPALVRVLKVKAYAMRFVNDEAEVAEKN